MSKHKPNRTPSPIAPVESGGGGMASKFMRENPVGKLTDAPEIAEGRDKPFAGDVLPIGGETPEQALAETLEAQPVAPTAETPSVNEGAAAEKPGEAAPPPSSQPQAETPAEPAAVAPTAQPAAEAKPAEPVAPSLAKLDREAKYELLPGHEWTGEQILAGLQQRAELAPKAEAADKFSTLLGGSYEESEARWKPFLEQVAKATMPQREFAERMLTMSNFDPQQAEFAERLLSNPDPALLAYLQSSEQEFYAPQYGNQRPTQTQPAAPAQDIASNPAIQHFQQVAREMEDQLATMRFNSERARLFSEYPFLQANDKARQLIYDRAAEMYALDAQNGKALNQRRGLLDAMAKEKLFLDSMAIANANAAPSRVEPSPTVGAKRLLPGGGGPGASGSARPAPPSAYRGDPDKARDQFLTDYPD